MSKLVWAMVTLSFLVGAPLQTAAEGEEVRLQRGNALFQQSCARCHGAAGLGDGPDAGETRNPVANLTQIAARHGGVYPAALVADIIDGRRHLRSHGPGGMPVWGKKFGPEGSGSSAGAPVARDRIRLLVDYLGSIQAGVAAEPEKP